MIGRPAWQCYFCKKWDRKNKTQPTINRAGEKSCYNCFGSNLIRERYQKQYQNKNKWE